MSIKSSSVVTLVFGLLAALLTPLAGCGDNWLPEGMLPDPGDSSKEITRFTVNGVDGTITGTSIALVLPFGTGLTNLAPAITHTGAAVTPASGVLKDFTNPVSYTVFAADGSTQGYTATITTAPSDAKEITRFTLLGVDGAISGSSITLTLPFATAVTNLTPTIVHTGVSINPASGAAHDFTSPVAYTVTAADGSTRAYTVTVGVALGSSKDITRFTILGTDGTITGTSITLTLPFGTNLASLTPTITHSGAGISPASGAAQSFIAPVLYVVTAADMSTKAYTVSVHTAPSSAKDITQFTILGIDGTITGTTISLVVPFGVSLANLTPSIVHTGTSISPASGVAQSFTASRMYTVTAADMSTKVYTVNVTDAPSNSKDITQFTILGVDGTITGTTIALTLPNGTSLASLTPTITHTGASVSPLSGVAQSFTGPVTYTVTAGDGSTKDYTVTVSVAPSTSKDITKFTILGVDGAITGTSITLTLPFGTNINSLTPTIIHTGTSISPASGVAQSFASVRQYVVTAMDGSTKTYTVTVSIALDTSKDITRFTILGSDATISGTSITLQLPFGTSLTSLTPTITITGISVNPASGVAQDFTTPRQYVVTASDGSTKTYTATVTAALDNSKDITSFIINGVSGAISGTDILVWLPFGTNVTFLFPTVTHTGVSVNPPNNTPHDFTNPLLYTVTAADGSTKVYTATVMVAPPSAKDITSFIINGVSGMISGTTITVTLPLNTPVTSLSPTIVHTGVSVNPASGVPRDFTQPVNYTVTAADASVKTYTVTVIAPTAPVVVSINITPPDPSIAKGTDQQFIATATYSDTTTADVSTTAAWGSSAMTVATISGTGLAHGATVGTTNITAMFGGVTGMTTLKVTPATLVSIAVTPPGQSIAKGTNLQYTATGTYTDNSTQDITGMVTWDSTMVGVATISSGGLAHGEAAGTTTISATSGAVTGSTTLTVTLETLVSIAVTPPDQSIAKGTNLQYMATGTYTDSSTQNLTAAVTWGSSVTSVATITTGGLAHGVNQGGTLITATLGPISGSTTLTVTQETLVSITVTPPNTSIAKGTDQQFTATGKYTDNSTQDLTTQVTWSSNMALVASISNAALSQGLAHAASPGVTTIKATLGLISGTTTLTVTPATLASIAVTPPGASIAKGTNLQYTATGTYTDNSTQDLTDTVTWESSVLTVATISGAAGTKGLAHAEGAGSTTISAALGLVSGSTTLTVTPETLVSISVTPPGASIAKGTNLQYTATGTYTDGSTQDLTATAAWASSMTGFATISSASGSEGLAHATSSGVTTITATVGPVSGFTTLTVTPATLVSIAVTPQGASIAKGTDLQYTAIGTYTDNSTQDLTTSVGWDSSALAVATISSAAGSQGLAHATNPGMTTISATSGAITGTATLTVTMATLVSIAVTPADQSIAKGTNLQYTATGTYTDGSTQDLTATVSWSSMTTAVASISSAAGSEGLAHAEGAGTTMIGAASGLVSGSTTLTVTPATLVSIEVTPANQTIAKGTNLQFVATGMYTDGTTQVLTATAAWSSLSSAVATISSAAGSLGLAHAEAQGTTTITAKVGTISGSTQLTVSIATLVSIEVTPFDPTMPKGTSQPFTATGTYTDGSQQDLTTAVTWTSTDANVAFVSNAAPKGIVNAVNVGSAKIRATLGAIFGEVTVIVNAAVLVSITIDPVNPSIALGTNQQFTATGTYSDASTQDLTATATWVSSTPAVATVSSAAGSKGLATSVNVGTTTITATVGSIVGMTTLTVSAATLVRIDVTPTNPTLPRGTGIDFTATAVYSDATTQDVTAVVTWSSSNTAAATISNASVTKGTATTIAAGTTTITALDPVTLVSGTTLLTVSAGVLQSITVTPNPATIAIGAQVRFTAIGHYSDGTSFDITNSVTWSSSQPAVAGVGNGRKKRGITTGKKAGTVTITATSNGISGSAILTVTNATLTSIAILPANSTVPKKTKQFFKAIGTFTDGSTSDITAAVDWSSSSSTVATISNQPFNEGIATTNVAGTTTITAFDPTTHITGTTLLTVTNATLVSIAVTPATAGGTVLIGLTKQLNATATYSDATTKVVTREVTWTSANSAVAAVSNATPTNGLVTGIAAGMTSVQAQYPLTTVSGSMTVTVIP